MQLRCIGDAMYWLWEGGHCLCCIFLAFICPLLTSKVNVHNLFPTAVLTTAYNPIRYKSHSNTPFSIQLYIILMGQTNQCMPLLCMQILFLKEKHIKINKNMQKSQQIVTSFKYRLSCISKQTNILALSYTSLKNSQGNFFSFFLLCWFLTRPHSTKQFMKKAITGNIKQ